jgi:hypothetical protein
MFFLLQVSMLRTSDNESGLLPTPEHFDYNSARHPELWERDKKKYAEKGINLHCNLRQQARLGMLPTPAVADSKHSTIKTPSWESRVEQKHLAETVLNPYIQEAGGTPSQLNPRFVAEMMGFPANWTESPFQSGETNPSRDTGTQ